MLCLLQVRNHDSCVEIKKSRRRWTKIKFHNVINFMQLTSQSLVHNSFKKRSFLNPKSWVLSVRHKHYEGALLDMDELSKWKILFLLCLTHVNASWFTSDTAISVTVGVLDKYHSTCVYLLQSTRQRGECHLLRHIITFLDEYCEEFCM